MLLFVVTAATDGENTCNLPQDLWYSIDIKPGETVDLLKGITGYARPGTLTALMGSSGAGEARL
jgi:ABC-type multidrug transport system ATPase subunit